MLGSLSYPDFFDFRDQNHTLASAAIFRDRAFALTGEQGAVSLHGVKASAEFFDVLGIKPAIGRTFSRDDERGGGGPGGFKVILSDDFWRQHFGGDNNVLGRTIELDRRQYTVIGVMPPVFNFRSKAIRSSSTSRFAEDASKRTARMPQTNSAAATAWKRLHA